MNNVNTNPDDIWTVINQGIDQLGINIEKRPITFKNLVDLIGLMGLKITNL